MEIMVASKVHVHLLDDLDGSSADETVKFGLDSIAYEIDLTSEHAKELRTVLDMYVDAARKVRPVATDAASGTHRARGYASADRSQNKAVREWAKRRNIALRDRGRIPRRVVDQYEAAAGR